MKQAQISQLLPSVFQETLTASGPLAALLGVMETLHAPCEAKLEELDETFDARRTADPFVPFLARWVDLDWLLETPSRHTRGASAAVRLPLDIGRLRELVAMAAFLSQWRGTAKGLFLSLHIATGLNGFSVTERVPAEDGTPLPFHIRVQAPAGALPYRAMIERIISFEKPAYVTWELVFEPDAPGGA
jgi:phage tail-like protein